jgi:hypothetical protein
MKTDIEGRIRRQEVKTKRSNEPAPEDYGRAMRVYCQTGAFPEGTHPMVGEYVLKAKAFVENLREGLGIRRGPEPLRRIPFPKEETDGA